MTKEEIKKNAKEYASKNSEIIVDNYDSFVTSEEFLEQGYADGAESRQVEIDIACAIIKDFLLRNKLDCMHNNCNLCRFNSDYIERAEKFLKEYNK